MARYLIDKFLRQYMFLPYRKDRESEYVPSTTKVRHRYRFTLLQALWRVCINDDPSAFDEDTNSSSDVLYTIINSY